MKKILLCVSLLSMFAAGFVGCSQKREWNHEQRKAMREALRSYRQMVYLDDLTDAEFVLFTDQVAGELEGTYPVYATFVEMPGVTDTVDMVVVTTIVDELNADARNMRHIFPYNYLVAQGVLPAGLDHDQQKAFYNCFAALFRHQIVALFIGPEYAAYQIAVKGLPYFAFGFIFFAVNMIGIGYYQSIERAHRATVITLLRGILFMLVGFLVLPILLDVKGIWLAVPLAEVLTLLLIGSLYLHEKQKQKS